MMFGNRCQFDYDEETIEPKAEKENSKRKSNAMPLKAFLAKWQWASLKNADEVLTQSEQKVWGIMEENERLKAEIEAECQEHIEAMRVADKAIKVLEKELKDWQDGTIIAQWQDCEQRVKELEYELAEKDVDLSLARNEIDTLKHNLNISQEHDNVMCEQYFEKCKQHNQDKISFAVAYLELLKAFIIDKEFYFVGEDYSTVYVEDITEEIDNQIQELRGQE